MLRRSIDVRNPYVDPINLVQIELLTRLRRSRDTPELLTKYAKGFQADPDKWLFLTGDKAKIYHLIWGSFLMPVQEETGERRQPGFEFIHTTNILLVDEKGVVQGKWSSTDEAEFGKLRRDLHQRLRKGTATEEKNERDSAAVSK